MLFKNWICRIGQHGQSYGEKSVEEGVRGRIPFSKLFRLLNYSLEIINSSVCQGYKLTVYDVNKSAIANLMEAGANNAPNIAEMSKDVKVVISMLPSNKNVLDVYTAKNGILR